MGIKESRFGLGRAVLGSRAFLPISSQDYSHLCSAKVFVSEALAFEEKYDLLVSNYLELEKTLNDIAADHLVYSDHSYQSMNDCRVLINQRVQNLLSACRLYLDHGAHHVSNMESAVPNLAAEFDALRRKQYDENAGYRIGEALRNHSQHRGFPIAGLSSGGGWVSRPGAEEVLLHRIQIHIDMEELREGKRTKASVLEDIAKLGESADARFVLREYVARLSALHQLMRTKLQDVLAEREVDIEAAIERFKLAFPEEQSVAGLAAVECDSDGNWINQSALFMGMIERRRHFLKRNQNLTNLKRWHVSSEPN